MDYKPFRIKEHVNVRCPFCDEEDKTYKTEADSLVCTACWYHWTTMEENDGKGIR